MLQSVHQLVQFRQLLSPSQLRKRRHHQHVLSWVSPVLRLLPESLPVHAGQRDFRLRVRQVVQFSGQVRVDRPVLSVTLEFLSEFTSAEPSV